MWWKTILKIISVVIMVYIAFISIRDGIKYGPADWIARIRKGE